MMKRTLLAASALALTLVGAPGLTGANAQAASADINNGRLHRPDALRSAEPSAGAYVSRAS